MTNATKQGLRERVYRYFASNTFFFVILGLFGVTSLWVALTSLYPMAFDEDFHFGLIKIYAEVWSPFSVVQKESYDIYGSIVTDPSYLYHYLMSFPYRFLSGVGASDTTIIVLLRILNIVLFGGALWVYRKVLL